MSSLPRLAACLLLAAACASQPPPPEPSAFDRLFDLPQERRGHAIAEFIRAAKLRVFVEVVPPATFEAEYGEMLPIGLEEFDILHVLVAQDHPDLTLGPAVALLPEGRPGAGPLPMFAPTRDLFVAFTKERPAGSHTRRYLKATGLPWYINFLTVGVLEIASLELRSEVIEPDEEAQIRATPRAQKLAVIITPPHGCGAGRSPCDRYYVVPRPRDDVALRLELDLEVGEGRVRVPALRMTWNAPLPAGKPLADRLTDLFHGEPLTIRPASIEPAYARPADPALCRLDQRECVAPTDARAREPAPPPAIAAPAQLATPAESRAAQPAWSRDDNYAPATTLEQFAAADLVAGGPLQGALLVCDFTARGGPDPRELVAELTVGALPPYTPEVARHDGKNRLIVPLVQLDPGDTVSFKVWRRTHSWFWGTSQIDLGRAALKYTGTLPLTHDARGLAISCVALGRAGLERAVNGRIEAFAGRLAEFDVGVDPVSEDELDWGVERWIGDLQRGVEAIAGLVGWSDPRIAALLPALAHYHQVFARRVGRLLATRYAQAPAPGTQLPFENGDLRVIGSACGDAIDRKRILWAREKVAKDGCVTIVEVIGRGAKPLEFSPRTGSLGVVWRSHLVWEDGRRADAWAVGVELPPDKRRRDPEHPRLADGESARLYLAPEAPYHREGELGPLMLHTRAGGDSLFIRLR